MEDLLLRRRAMGARTVDYSQQPLTFVFRATGRVKFSAATEYSIDGGSTWVSLAANTNSPQVRKWGKIMFRASGLPVTIASGIGTFSFNADVDVEGNIMSMQAGANFAGVTTIGANYQFRGLFYNNSHIIEAGNLILPATTLKEDCYRTMMELCTNLRSTPQLPAATLQSRSYQLLFEQSPNVNYIFCMARNISATNCLQIWVRGVAATGIFVKHYSATWTATGDSGVPTGWTLLYYSPGLDRYYLDDKTTICDKYGNPI